VTINAGTLALEITERGAAQVEEKLDRIDRKAKQIGNTPVKMPVTPPSSTDLTLIDRQLEQMGKQIPLYKQGAQFASTKKQSLKELGDVEHQLRNIVAGSNTTLEQRIGAEKQLAQLESLRPARMKANATAIGGMSSAIGTATKALGAMGVVLSAGALVSGFTGMVRDAINAGDALHDLKMRTGVSVEALSVLGKVATKSGASPEALTVGFRNLSKAVENLRAGNKEAVASFAALGISAKDIDGLSLDQVFVKIADAQEKFADGSGKSATMSQIFGRAGEALIPTLHELADGGFARAKAQAEAFGGVISEDFANKADVFNDTLEDMRTAVGGLGIAIADQALPQMTAMAAMLTTLISKGREWLPMALGIAGRTVLAASGPLGWAALWKMGKASGEAARMGPLNSDPALDALLTGPAKDKPDVVRDPFAARRSADAANQRAIDRALAISVGMPGVVGEGGFPKMGMPGAAGTLKGEKAFGLADVVDKNFDVVKARTEERRRELGALLQDVGNTIGGALASGFTAAFQGGNFLAEMGKALLAGIGGMLVQLGSTMLTWGLLMSANLGWLMATPFAAQALSGPASIAVGTGLIALGAGLGAIGGGGSKGGGGGSAGGGRTQQAEQDEFSVAFDPDKKLRRSSGSAVQPSSRGLSNAPMPEGRPVVHIGTINSLSPDDAKWQRAVAETYTNARNRGLVKSG
jgi:hypothetical protein